MSPLRSQAEIEGKTLKVLEVGDLTLPLRREAPGRMWPLLGRVMPGLGRLCLRIEPDEGEVKGMGLRDSEDDEVHSALLPDTLLEMIRSMVQPSVWEDDGARLEMRGSRLFVVQSKSVQDRVQEFLAELSSVLTEPVQMEMAIYLDEDGARPSRGFEAMSWTEARKRLSGLREVGGAQLLHATRATIRPGERLYLGTQGEGRVQIGFQASVSKGAKMITPKNVALRIGTGLVIEVLQVPGQDGMALFATLEHRQLKKEAQIKPLGTPETHAFERADLAESVTAFSLLLPRRGAFLYAPGGSQVPGLRLLLTFHRSQPAGPGSISVLPHGLLSRRLHQDHVRSNVEHDTSEDLGTQVLGQEEIIDLLQGLHPEVAEAGDYRMKSNALALFLSGGKNGRQLMRKSLEQMMLQRTRSFLATLVWEKRPLGSNTKWEDHGLPMTMPILARRSGATIQGRTVSFVRGYEGEIAEEAATQQPLLEALYSGLQSQLVLLPKHGEILALLECSVTSTLGIEQRDAFALGQGITERPRQSGRFLERKLRIQPGTRESLGSGPRLTDSEGKTWETRLGLQVLELRSTFWAKD